MVLGHACPSGFSNRMFDQLIWSRWFTSFPDIVSGDCHPVLELTLKPIIDTSTHTNLFEGLLGRRYFS
jgi:hypothetical protein